MRGYIRREPTDEVEKARVRHAEACELRLARIQNGSEPTHRNGPWPVELVQFTGDIAPGWQWRSQSGRVSPKFRSKSAAEDWRKLHPAWD